MIGLAIAALVLWLVIFLLPWKSWLVKEQWDIDTFNSQFQSLQRIGGNLGTLLVVAATVYAYHGAGLAGPGNGTF